jgi:hypothetical protein
LLVPKDAAVVADPFIFRNLLGYLRSVTLLVACILAYLTHNNEVVFFILSRGADDAGKVIGVYF